MSDDDLWAEYARLLKLADSDHLSDAAWAVDEALGTILDEIEYRRVVSAQQADNLLTNRARKQRLRRDLLARHVHLLPDSTASEDGRIEARSELARHQARCDGREWRVLTSIGLGETNRAVADAEGVPEATVKTWVRRARMKLVA